MTERVLLVDDWPEWNKLIPSWHIEKFGAEVHVVETVEEAGKFFNGETRANVLFISGLSGAATFVRTQRTRFPKTRIVGFSEHRQILSDVGCNLFVNRQTLGLTVASFLEL